MRRDQRPWEDRINPEVCNSVPKLFGSLSRQSTDGPDTGHLTQISNYAWEIQLWLSSDWVQGILQLPAPLTWEQLWAFLWLTKCCRIWIPSYGRITQPLHESLKRQDDSIPMAWWCPQKKAEAALKQALIQAPALKLLGPEKPFQLYGHEREGIALGLQTQRLGPEPQAVAYISKRLNPNCLRLASLLSKPRGHSSSNKRCPKALTRRWANYFYQLPSETTFKWKRPLMDVRTKDSQISVISSVIISVTQSCPTLCDSMDCSTPGLPVHHQLPELVQTHVHWVSDAIQPSHPLSSPSPPAFNLSQHQGLFQWVSSLHEVAKVLEFQLHHQSFQWIFRTDFL